MTSAVNKIALPNKINLLRPVFIALLLTLGAEAVYFIAWGIILFPGGSLLGKLVWTLTCAISMAAVIGVLTMTVVNQDTPPYPAMLRAALSMAVVGIYCSFLCSQIDVHFNFFGGRENSAIFIAAGVVPAVVGGALYGWLVYAPTREDSRPTPE